MEHSEPESMRANRSDASDEEFLRLPSVIRRTGLARSTIYRQVAAHQFPAPVKLARRAIGWRTSDVDDWSQKRISCE